MNHKLSSFIFHLSSFIFHLSFFIFHLSFFIFSAPAAAQDALWATGSAVPDGTQQLTRRADGQFRFAGPLRAGELKIMTTADYQPGTTQFLKPQLQDSYLINYGLNYVLTTDETQPGWVVSFDEETYRFLVDTSSRKVTGELALPWNELLIAGSAFEGGSDGTEWKRDNMLPFTRDHENPYVFTWTGELGDFGGVEPGRFKLEGQMTWGPRELHPFSQDEDILSASQARTGGDDTKWHVSQPGTYTITVDLFNETVKATKH
ncbi:MAG: SusF/SusE family outer membrane protein [Prevotella sp.]|nr:SusF/SusE family outer membrane protein [Prevotella sp.]